MKTHPALLRNTMLFARTLKEHLYEHGEGTDTCSFLQFRTLALVSEKKNLSMQELASLLYISPPSTSELASRLIRHGELIKKPDKKDKRITRLSITSKGKEMLTKRINKIMTLIKPVFKNLTEQEQHTLNHILIKIIKHS